MNNLAIFALFVAVNLLGISVIVVSAQKNASQMTAASGGKFFGSLFGEGGLFGGHYSQQQPSGGGTQTPVEYGNRIQPVDPSNLKLVVVVTRHGSRAPTETYPNDPYPYTNPKYWPEGHGGLTRYGKQQLYRTGNNLRLRYSKYLSNEYRADEVKVFSNPIERILMSAQCLTTGLFPPTGYQIWNPNINWQPIPVYENSFDATKVISSSTYCPRAIQEENDALQEIENHYAEKFSDVFNVLSRYSGQDVRSIGASLGYYDVFQLQYENGLVLPRWTRDIFPEPLTTMSAIGNQAITAGTPMLIKLTAGPIMKTIFERMKRIVNDGSSRRKLYIDAAHDNTLIALLAGLGLTEPIYPGTSSYMIFELHKSREPREGHTVKAFYYNSSAVLSPTRLRIPGCNSEPCRFEDFETLVNDISPENWDDDCQL